MVMVFPSRQIRPAWINVLSKNYVPSQEQKSVPGVIRDNRLAREADFVRALT
jgi:hypothetical protein